ncbi:MAG: GGDEF domain-containing protein [Betaproteobacteria bacterium]
MKARSLAKVLGQSEFATEMVKQSAAELASVNTVLKEEIAHQDQPPAVADALEKSAAVEKKVEQASEKLSAVNRALEGEIRDRDLLDHELAAAREQEQAARHAAFHDVLTGLPNRALFNDRLEHGMAQARRHGWTLAVMFMDMDRFKEINDTHGHDIGDLVLQSVAQRLTSTTRGDDTVSRLGGDEFLYLLMEVRDENSIGLIARKIIAAVEAPLTVGTHERNACFNLKASIGISIFPQHGTTVDTLIISADLAMYQAKQRRSRYAFAT